ncbi:adenylate/guanylate cyclase domain-containing protein [Rhodoferax sp.]|uniref:CHASE2 domain-containing protein n=1 Tax=Rhodoferax sp. TaxID=50421 RepID=UPI002606FE39|nr:adenylate/guanylate cyclase domain-containing protein [Rhodoferax sp.]MDD5481014.1 adenylate/guanylate cyclase domain-containing protein [Rhodoferax sp.]
MKKISFFKLHALRIALSLVIVPVLMLHVVGVLNLGFVARLENYAYDLRLNWTMPGTVDKRIVIVDIDEKSLAQQGHWPWPRNQVAHMVDVLFDTYQIDVLGFDVLFAERDQSSGLASLERLARDDLKDNAVFSQALNRLRPSLRYDDVFAQSLKNRAVVLGYYFQHGKMAQSKVGQLPQPILSRGSFVAQSVGAMQASGYSANLPELQAAAAAAGFFNASPLIDDDGVFRRISLLQAYDGALYETLSLAMARLALRETRVQLNFEGSGKAQALESLQMGQRRIPVDADVASLVPYRGRQGSFVYVSASDVLQAKVPPEVLRGAIVLVGTTAPGLLDLRTTPVQEAYAGVELHANMIAGILDGTIKERPAYVLGLELVLLLVTGLLFAVLLPVLSPLMATLSTIGLSAATVAVNLWLWNTAQLIVPLASGLVLIAGLFVFNMTYGFFVDARAKRLLARLFGQYVPPELVDEMAQDPGAYSLAGENRHMTVLFSDVRGFTSISEGLSPAQLTELMNAFLTPMTKIIHGHRGTIDKYMGDAIMAFWGAPLSDPQHARHALLAAMDMVVQLLALEGHFKAKGWPPIKIGVGVNTGDMTVGNMGSEFRLAYTVMGDAVNLGSRLESLTKTYGVQIIVSEFTRAAVPDFAFKELDCVRVKGKEHPVKIFEPLGLQDELSEALRQELALYQTGLQHYQTQNWPVAAQVFAQLQVQHPDCELYRLYAQRVLDFTANPPGIDWDGTYTFLTK